MLSEGNRISERTSWELQTLWEELAALERIVSDQRMEFVFKQLNREFSHPTQWRSYFGAVLGGDVNFEEIHRKLTQADGLTP